jgi:voltage-gated potassium channel
VADHAPTGPAGKWLARRVEKRGLRPRVAIYLVLGFWSAAVVIFGVLERLADPETFGSIWEGMWWAVQTVTTVGYGDVVPNQTSGKVIAGILMLGGLSTLAVLTGAITSGFVAQAQRKQTEAETERVMLELRDLKTQITTLREEIGRPPPAGRSD